MSSAILYLAIIAIWACVLVPRWIRKPHRVPEADELPGLKYVSTSGQADSGVGRGSSASGDAPPAAWAAAGAAMASAATARADAARADAARADAARADAARADAAGAAPANADGARAATARADAGTGAGTADAAAEKAAEADARKATEAPRYQAGGGGVGQPVAVEAPRYQAGGGGVGQPVAVEEGVAWHRVTRSYHSEHQVAQRPQPQQEPARPHILQARRRLLTTLVTLAVAALACAVANLTPWWILVPPVGMLGMYVLLLREAAQADAEQERWLAQERAAQAEAARLCGRQAWEASQPQPTAEIIDISARVTDQLYDQYADAAVRAVGD